MHSHDMNKRETPPNTQITKYKPSVAGGLARKLRKNGDPAQIKEIKADNIETHGPVNGQA